MSKKNTIIKKFLGRRDLQIFLILLFIYSINLRVIGSDVHTNEYVSISIIKELDFDLDEYASYIKYFQTIQKGKDHLVSMTSIGNSILAVPIYFFPVVFFDISYNSLVVAYLGKLAATVYVALSAVFIYYTLKRLTKEKYALYITLIYAFATGSWSISSQALWTHGPIQFLLAVSIYLLVLGLKNEKYVAYSGFPLATAIVCKETNFLIFVVIGIYVLHRHRKQFIKFALFALPPIAFLFFYNYYYFGSVFMFTYHYYYLSPDMVDNPFLNGFFGLLISPSRGLFVYSPILIFALYGMYDAWKKRKILFCYFTIAILLVISLYANFKIWYGGHSWGPRYMYDILPLFSILLLPGFEKAMKRKNLKYIFIFLLIFSVFVQLEGILFFNGEWHTKYDIGLKDQSWLWSIDNMQIMYYLRNPHPESLI